MLLSCVKKWKLSYPPFQSLITHLSLKTLTLETRLYCFNWGRGVNVNIFQFLSFDFHVQVIKIYSIVLYLKKSTVGSWHVNLSLPIFFLRGGIYPLIMKVFKLKRLEYGTRCWYFCYLFAGSGIGTVFGSLIIGYARNPSLKNNLFTYAVLGFALSEAMGLFCFLLAAGILFAF